MDLNATERRTLGLASTMVLVGAIVRMATAPGPADVGWAPADSTGPGIEALRRDVEAAIELKAKAERPLADGETIDANTASVEQFDRLPGVGPVTASAIVRYRENVSRFGSMAELEAVPGIGPTSAQRLAPYLRFGSTRDRGPSIESDKIDVNRAQVDDLQQITGIGPVLASRIVEVRARLGRFATPEDLLLVPGIGPVILAKIREQMRFE